MVKHKTSDLPIRCYHSGSARADQLSLDLQRELQPHPELWFEDGNVVLIAENRSFRVPKSVLARTSEFFRDMFSLPQPPLDGAEGDTVTPAPQCPMIPTSESADVVVSKFLEFFDLIDSRPHFTFSIL